MTLLKITGIAIAAVALGLIIVERETIKLVGKALLG